MHLIRQWLTTVEKPRRKAQEKRKLAYNDYIESIRETEFPMLKGKSAAAFSKLAWTDCVRDYLS